MFKRKKKKDERVYSDKELIIAATAKLIPDGLSVIADNEMGLAAAILAKNSNAPRINIFYLGESKKINEIFPEMNDVFTKASSFIYNKMSPIEALESGLIDIGLISLFDDGQVDRYGNVNTTVLGKYAKPKKRLRGSGFLNDIMSLAKCSYIMAKHSRGVLCNCDYLTAVGHLKGGDSRLKNGLFTEGPKYIITEKAYFDFDPKSKKAHLAAINEGVTKKEIKRNMGWRAL